ncbi:MAG: type II toxin-antitoxin system RelE/ParE family toxin [bacterium]
MTSSRNKILQRTNRFARDLRPLPEEVKAKAFETAQKLCVDVFHPELDVRPMTGLKGYYRVIVANEYRIIFSFDNDTIFLRRIAHRKEIYRNLEL